MSDEAIKGQLIVHDGLRLKPYKDSVGKLTIGVGRNLDDVGISKEEAMILLDNDLVSAESELDRALPWWRTLDIVRQRVLLDMAFNLGINRLLGFRQALLAMQKGHYEMAAAQMLDSKWAEQVGKRATTLAQMMRG